MPRVVTGVMFIVAGAVLVAFGASQSGDPYEEVVREGVFAPATVVAVDGDTVTLEYRVRRELYRGVARPAEGGPYSVGDVVQAAALLGDPERVVIRGAGEPRTYGYVGWLLAGVLVVIGGLGVALASAIGRGSSGTLPRDRWIGERHGS